MKKILKFSNSLADKEGEAKKTVWKGGDVQSADPEVFNKHNELFNPFKTFGKKAKTKNLEKENHHGN
jgi:hypothetical protein